MSRAWIRSLAALAGVALAVVVALGFASSQAKDELGWKAMLTLVRSRFPEVKQLSTTDLAAWIQDTTRTRPQILDVREQAEFEVSHLAGATRVSPDASAQDILTKLDPNRPIVLYCSVGYRSSKLATRLIQEGRRDVSNLEGSVFTWANEGRPLVTPEGKSTTLVHPFDSHYGQLLKPEHRAP